MRDESKIGSFASSSPFGDVPITVDSLLPSRFRPLPGDLVFVMRDEKTNPAAVRQFARILKHGLRIHGLRCVEMYQI